MTPARHSAARGADPPSLRDLSLSDRDAALRRRLIARDELALAELIELATPWLLGVAERILHDADEAEEVVSDALLTAWNRIELLAEDDAMLMPWLLRITRNRAIDRLRRRASWRRRATRALIFGALPDPVVPAVEPNEAAHPGWHVHESVHAALGALPDDQRTAVELAYFGGLTHSEVAGRLGIPIGTVKTRLRLAFDKLRGTLAPLKGWVP
jgi:RNA polymerase sigma-70 factor (ECF subfamily)